MERVVRVADIDAGWLSGALSRARVLADGGRVVNASREVCGTGQLADSYRFTLTYDPPGSGPATVVGKFASEDATSRAFGQQSGYYMHEIRFYEQLAPALARAGPTPLHAALDANETDFVLLMADMSPARAVDQLVGCTPDEAAAAVEQVAALHAGSWHDPRLAAVDWIKGTAASFAHVTDSFATITGTFRERFGDLVPQDQLDEAAKLNEFGDRWKAIFTEPRCLWHSDLRAAGHGVNGYSGEQCWDDYRIAALHGLQTGIFGLGTVRRSARGDEMWRVWIERTCDQVRDLDSYIALAARGR